MAGKISSCNFRDISKHNGIKSNIFSSVQIKLYSRKTFNSYKYSTYRKVTFMFVLSHLLQGRSKLCCAGRYESLPPLLGKCLRKLMLSPATKVKVDGPVWPRTWPVSKRACNGPVFRSLNISTFHNLKPRNGPIVFIIFTGPL